MSEKTWVLCLGNQKGGCAKTTDTLNIAYCLANEHHKKVLVLDLDSQASLSIDLGLNVTDENFNTIDQLLGARVKGEINEFKWRWVKDFIYTPTYNTRKKIKGVWQNAKEKFGFDVMPSSTDLAMVDLQMSMAASSNPSGKIYLFYIRDLINSIKANADYDFILMDTPPALSAITTNAMSAATAVIVPSNLELMSFRGIKTFKESVDFVMETANSLGYEHRGILGILLSSYSERRSVDKALEEYVHDFYPIPTFTTQIRDSADARRAVASGLLFVMINKKAREDYNNVSKEIIYALEDPKGWQKKTKEVWENVKKQRKEEASQPKKRGKK